MKNIIASNLLSRALAADAIGSGILALVQLAGAGAMSRVLALPRDLLVESGAFMLVYAAVLGVMARSRRLPIGLVRLIVLGNLGWAAGCLVLPLTGSVVPNPPGAGFLALHAVWVLVFAALQFAGLRTSAAATGTAASSPSATAY